MPDANDDGSPLEAAAGVAGPATTGAFKLVSNETRLAILLALWEEFEPFEDSSAVRFSDLRERVGMRDSGQFSYHLERLEGRFVDSTDDGWSLRDAGLELVQTIIGGAAIEDATLGPTPIDMTCSLCGGDVVVEYADGWVTNACTDCDGLFDREGSEYGVLSKFSLAPAGLTDRSAEEIYAAAWVRGFQRVFSMLEGVCPTCSGPVDRWLFRCPDHQAAADGGVCETCGNRPELVARLECAVCKEWATSTLGGVARYHPAAVGFHWEHDLPLQYGFNDIAHINDRLARTEMDWEVLAEDPLVVRVTLGIDGDEMCLDLREDLAVVDVGG